MNGMRIRAVKLDEKFGINGFDPYAVQVSFDHLAWWTVSRHAEKHLAIQAAQELEAFVSSHLLVKPTHIFWSTKV